MPGWDYHWGDGWGYGWVGSLLMIITMLVLWGGLITVIVLLIRRLGHHGPDHNDAQRILDERFARGEIDKDEYGQRSQALRSGRRT